jgi:hypothetical protein
MFSTNPAAQSHVQGKRRCVPPVPRRGRLWLLWGVAAGILGFLATIIFDVRPWTEADYAKRGVLAATAADMAGLDPLGNRIGFILGFSAVICLLVFQGFWSLRVSRSLPDSVASRVVTAGVIASAAGLTYGYAWKGVLGLYGYGGDEYGSFDDQGLLVFYALSDFGAFIPWLGVVVALGAMAWIAWADRGLSRIGGSLVAAAVTLVAAGYLVTGVPGLAGPVGGLALAFITLWMLVDRRGVGGAVR